MTVTIQSLRTSEPTLRWYFRSLWREIFTALLLGFACGLVVGFVVLIWQHAPMPALVIGASVTFCLLTACVTGLSVPAALHALKLDPKIAAGPITLAVADIFTLLFYFNLARLLL
jgi:magnesium transporter